MPSYFVFAAIGLVVAYAVHNFRCFQSNLAAAKQSGLPYVVLPVWTFNRFWLVTHRLWLPIIKVLPDSWTREWIEYVNVRSLYTLTLADPDIAG
jgi:hypothetical protein